MNRSPLGQLRSALAAVQRPSGGWGWQPGKAANTECTALAVLALGGAPAAEAAGAVGRGIDWLRRSQRANGSWPVSEQVPQASWSTALAVLALRNAERDEASAAAGFAWLVSARSHARSGWRRRLDRIFPDRRVLVDPDLVGWPWTEDASAWVEPTAWSLLALKGGPGGGTGLAAERIRQAELLLMDRMCEGGGWNYGNRRVMGVALPPYPDTTALALVALQDRPADLRVRASLERLEGMIEEQQSSLVLALGVLSLQLHGRDVSGMRDALRTATNGGSATDTRTLALSILALRGEAVPLRVGHAGPA